MHWECTVFPLADFTVAMIGMNIKKCDMQFLKQHSFLHICETTQYILYATLKKGLPLVNTKAYGGQHPKDHHRVLSKIVSVDSPFHHRLILLYCCLDLEKTQS